MVELHGGGDAAESRRRRGFDKPSWLLCTIADLDERIKAIMRKMPRENSSDSFGVRANPYYHERPQLLACLHDLYSSYLSLADRYCQLHRRRQCSSPAPVPVAGDRNDDGEDNDSDAESSLSFQQPPLADKAGADAVVADLVMKNVEYDILMDELNLVEKMCGESSRKMELQQNLLDVLESERLILLNDNATLGYRVTVLVEENKGLASESLFLKRKAAELARCVLKTREDHREDTLSRKIEDLQAQIHRLEKRNKEYYEQLTRRECLKNEDIKERKNRDGKEVSLEECFRGGGTLTFSKCLSFNMKKLVDPKNAAGMEKGKMSSLWVKVKNLDMVLCKPKT